MYSSCCPPCSTAPPQLHHLKQFNEEWSALEAAAMCDSAPSLFPSLPVAYFILTHLLVVMKTPNVTDFYHPNPPKPSYGHYRRRKKIIPHFKSYSTTQNTPVGALHTVYDLYHN